MEDQEVVSVLRDLKNSIGMPLTMSWDRGFVLFFFQADDGIRARTVTGVQTCALPISAGNARKRPRPNAWNVVAPTCAPAPPRSEERRVGKECRCRWSAYLEKKK